MPSSILRFSLKNTTFHAHGKLLLTAEYFVLDGAKALAVPVKFGQSLTMAHDPAQPNLHWKSLDEKGRTWFEATFAPATFSPLKSTDNKLAARLSQIFCEAKKMGGALNAQNIKLKTNLTFPRNWGLGTSSTLIHLVAQWAGADAFGLQFRTFGGSGYDIACAGADGPLFYTLKNGKPEVEKGDFSPPFSGQLYFVFLEKKQDSRAGIAQFRNKNKTVAIEKITALTDAFFAAKNLSVFEKLIREHERLVGTAIGLPRAKELYFPDFWGEVKSLGAWGGDFVLATSDRPLEETKKYFNEKGFGVFFRYADMVL